MKLAEYLTENEITEAAFAEKVGVTQPTIHRYVNNDRFPDPAMIERMLIATDGKVAVSDWYEQAAQARRQRVAAE